MRPPTRHISLVLLGATLVFAACDSTSGEPTDDLLGDRSAMLRNIGENVILAEYRGFEAEAATLEGAVAAWAAAPADTALRDEARAAWRSTMMAWQRAELYQVGPAGVMGTVAGGIDLRDEIYSWPLVNPCRVAQELVEEAYVDPMAFAGEQVNVRGLDTLEYLLFVEGTANECAPNATINTDGSWAALDAAALDARRAAYALTAAKLVTASAATLAMLWDPAGGAFVDTLADAREGNAVYGGTQDALNALTDALFYIESETKDMKVGQPSGVLDCLEATCPDARESRWAEHNIEALRANLEAFRTLYLGGAGEGFDDLLVDLGAANLDADIRQRIDGAVAAIDALGPDLVAALNDDPAAAVGAYDALKTLTDLMKTQFMATLDLELPEKTEGDND